MQIPYNNKLQSEMFASRELKSEVSYVHQSSVAGCFSDSLQQGIRLIAGVKNCVLYWIVMHLVINFVFPSLLAHFQLSLTSSPACFMSEISPNLSWSFDFISIFPPSKHCLKLVTFHFCTNIHPVSCSLPLMLHDGWTQACISCFTIHRWDFTFGQ